MRRHKLPLGIICIIDTIGIIDTLDITDTNEVLSTYLYEDPTLSLYKISFALFDILLKTRLIQAVN